MSRKYSLNMSCGQTDIYPAALTAMSKQLHTPIYFKPYYDLEVAMMDKLKRALFTKNDIVVMPGTATYGEEAAMQSLLEPGDEVLTVNTGAFGRVLKNLADIVTNRIHGRATRVGWRNRDHDGLAVPFDARQDAQVPDTEDRDFRILDCLQQFPDGSQRAMFAQCPPLKIRPRNQRNGGGCGYHF